MKRWDTVQRALEDDLAHGCGPIQLVAEAPFYDESLLPFSVAGGGRILRIVPERGFRKEALTETADERLLVVDCPDDEGWLVPADVVAAWYGRHVSCPRLEDVLLASPLYEYLTRLDEEGRSRGGQRGQLVQWAPAMPELASLYPPEFLPEDEEAPAVNRERKAYARAVARLLHDLEEAFDLLEIELSIRYDRDAHEVTPQSA
jgi:hypothetical protein